MKKQIKLLLLLCIPLMGYTQNFSGFQYDNYAGLHAVSANPAFLVGSPYRADINLVSASLTLNNDYIPFDFSKAISGDFEDFDDVKKNDTPSNSNNFLLSTDIFGPSFMFNINEVSAFAITSKVRSYISVTGIDGESYDYFNNGFEQDNDYSFGIKSANITTHVWGEVGFSYARIIDLDNDATLKLGITAKYLQGLGNIFIAFDDFQADYDSVANTLNTSGEISYGSSTDFESGKYQVSSGAKGYGFDIGAVYQFSPEGKNFNSFERYKFRLAASITDIGKVTYPEGIQTTYNVTRNNITITELESEDGLEDTLKAVYPGQSSTKDLSVKLPTALHLNIDYNMNNSFYVNLNTDFGLGDDSNNANRIINKYSLTPRFERKWTSVYSPLSLDGFDNFSWGFGFRLGPLFVGSNTILSNLMKPTKKVDVHLGLKIPLFKRSKLKKESCKPI